MSVDYDLVIIGGSLAAREAALMAVRSRANVALVESPSLNLFVGINGLAKVARSSSIPGNLRALNLKIPTGRVNVDDAKTPDVIRWCDAVDTRILQQISPAYLAGQGIDFIHDSGEFTAGKKLAFVTNQRKLTARRYLLATGSHPWIPPIEGLSTSGFVTINNLMSVLVTARPPRSWVVLGGSPQAIEVAQILVRLGSEVTLITTRSQIWENTSPDVIQLLQAQLEADGVEIICDQKVTQVRTISGKKWLQVGDKAIESDEILVAVAQQPNLDGLNLAAVDVKWRPDRLIVNNYLQTTNTRIYACGDVIGGYSFFNLASYEARIAVDNSLFMRQKSVNYQQVSYTINTQPPLAQIGLTLAQAKTRYPDQVTEVREYFQDLTISQITGELTGLCSLIVQNNGQILGASIIGDTAGELVNIIALAMQQNIQIKHLINLPLTSPSYSQIFRRIAQQWQEYKLSQNFFYQEFLDDFFQFRRHFNL